MLDEKVRAVLARLEAEDAEEREQGVPREQRARQVARTTGQFLFALVADPAKVEAWRRNIFEAGLEETVELVEGDAFETLPQIEDVFDVVFIDAEKEDYEQLFMLSRDKVEQGALVVADNVLSHVETLGAYSDTRKADPTTESVTVPLDRGLELSVILTDVP